jgi:tRNA threonylcarbamoyladenosine biosynthesis protein TsaB
MLILALDTTSRAGSIALARDGHILECHVGLASRTHAERLPADVLALLDRHALRLASVDVFAVAAGPGSFTGLRIGIATIQGLAFAARRQVVAVSALEALAWLGTDPGEERLVAAWIDAQRQEVFSALYACAWANTDGERSIKVIDAAAVAAPDRTLERWRALIAGREVRFIGDGALSYSHVLARFGHAGLRIVDPAPPLAPAIAEMAALQAARGGAVAPFAVKPLYVRRPDAELARDGRQAKG